MQLWFQLSLHFKVVHVRKQRSSMVKKILLGQHNLLKYSKYSLAAPEDHHILALGYSTTRGEGARSTRSKMLAFPRSSEELWTACFINQAQGKNNDIMKQWTDYINFFSDGAYFQLHRQTNQGKGMYRKGVGKIFLSPTWPLALCTIIVLYPIVVIIFKKLLACRVTTAITAKQPQNISPHNSWMPKEHVLEFLLKFFTMYRWLCVEWSWRMGVPLTLSRVPFPTQKDPDAFCRSKHAPYVPSASTGYPVKAQKSSRGAFTGCNLN